MGRKEVPAKEAKSRNWSKFISATVSPRHQKS